MQQEILKRLELIKTSILLEDDEIIELQIMKLTKLDMDEEVKEIIKSLENREYTVAVLIIENYLSRYSGVVEYHDPAIQGLKMELKSLETKLQNLIEQKTEYLTNIEEFNKEYSLHLGDLIKSILKLKKELLYKHAVQQEKVRKKLEEDEQTFKDTKETIEELRNTIDELGKALDNMDIEDENYDEIYQAYQVLQEELERLEDEVNSQEEELEKTKQSVDEDTASEEYEEAKSQYDEFESEYEHFRDIQKDTIELNDEEKKELKKLYKKAARLCHPDLVPDELKQKAHQLIQQLNEAYGKKNLTEVKKILHSLETGTGFEVSSNSINDKELLEEKIEEYKNKIVDIENELIEIQQDETFQIISDLDEWDDYFEKLKTRLENEKEILLQQVDHDDEN